MTNSAITDDIRRYVMACVPSVPYIEAVLLMREGTGSAWSAAVLGRRLYLDEGNAARLLARLVADGIAKGPFGTDSGFIYAPMSGDIAQMWDRLADVYPRNLIEISTLIHSKSAGKAQILADGFVWRKEK